MAKSQQSFNKKEKEKKRRKKKKDKKEKREQRKLEREETGKKSFEDQLAYVDENGFLTDTPPDPTKKMEFKVEDMILGAPPKDDTQYDPIRKGMIKFFNHEKGYGFIIDGETKDSVFVHMNNLAQPVQENDRVVFEVENGPKGPNAVNVKLEA